MRKILIVIIVLLTSTICHAAYQTDSLTLTGLKNKAVVATDTNGKLIEGAAPNLSAYYKLDGSNANDYIYLTLTSYLQLSGNTVTLYVNSTAVQDWTITPTTPPAGTPMGMLLVITYW